MRMKPMTLSSLSSLPLSSPQTQFHPTQAQFPLPVAIYNVNNVARPVPSPLFPSQQFHGHFPSQTPLHAAHNMMGSQMQYPMQVHHAPAAMRTLGEEDWRNDPIQTLPLGSEFKIETKEVKKLAQIGAIRRPAHAPLSLSSNTNHVGQMGLLHPQTRTNSLPHFYTSGVTSTPATGLADAVLHRRLQHLQHSEEVMRSRQIQGHVMQNLSRELSLEPPVVRQRQNEASFRTQRIQHLQNIQNSRMRIQSQGGSQQANFNPLRQPWQHQERTATFQNFGMSNGRNPGVF